MKVDRKYSLILASNSPRRKELLGWMEIPFKVMGSNIEEHSNEKNPKNFAIDIAVQKGEAIWGELDFESTPHPLIVSSDTIVVLGDRIYGKPSSKEEAREMLLSLSGNEHKVITSVYLKAKSIKTGSDISRKFAIETDVTFSPITEDILGPYLEGNDSMDKAGAYGIQGQGLLFVESLKGSYSNVVGFPLVEFVDEMRELLCEGVLEEKLLWRSKFAMN